jgi:squalene-hopene/tetraprenyl-beta-curcumene cyclase
MMDLADGRFERAYQTTLAALLAERNAEGHWTGELSTSALSTATAVAALAMVQKHSHDSSIRPNPQAQKFAGLINGGLAWLASHQNPDGGWGDTVVSFSNISTTLLCRAAFHLADAAAAHGEVLQKANDWLGERYGRTPAEQAEAVRARYGKDRTFAVPILTTCALAGLTSWKEVPSLPFELACFPQSWFRYLKLQVVSYALPALIAIGQAIAYHRPSWNPITRLVRWAAKRRSLRVLEAIQPSSGGYLEAAPLTSFVMLSLASIGLADHPVVKNGVRFLVDSVRADGSWPIDTNLATWVTTFSVNALATSGELENLDRQQEMQDWLIHQQYKVRHPFTGAAPGGWAWTPLPGGVPDMDDTPGALLALNNLTRINTKDGRDRLTQFFVKAPRFDVEVIEAAISNPEGANTLLKSMDESWTDAGLVFTIGKSDFGTPKSHFDPMVDGMRWLLSLQNSDGGWPTFCRGWGHLPFDRSGSDLTAHAVRALVSWRWFLPHIVIHPTNSPRSLSWSSNFQPAIDRGLKYLARQQRPDGSWLPLWFGNQHAPNDENPTYGTAKVLAAYRDLDMMNTDPARRGVAWLLSVQNADGGWGGAANVPSSIEETALAVEVLIGAGPETANAVNNGLAYLVQQVENGGLYKPTPIGFYFARLWYFEKLYPIIFTLAALGRARRLGFQPDIPRGQVEKSVRLET